MAARLYESVTQKWRGPGLTMSRGLGDTDAAECLLEKSRTNQLTLVTSYFLLLAAYCSTAD